jgi:hypothetical protein
MAAELENRQWKIEDLLALLPTIEHKGGRPQKTN